ncbi:MAG: hypothetical protein Edafosvirus5_50 [Edafosvirus sp.]|uniref:Uncharacterized protein n=1 Tax=Edafosvirus sp. TaxID=2487765 RepID=A0A3G4ZTB1_9VIRU|nr:MAG: hypothetical protein Edafosvirus5_50 [Edafosvirus sp.]
MEAIKQHIITESITTALMNGRPLSNMWGFPDFVKKDNKLMTALFGSMAHGLYNELPTDEDKKSIIKWFETHGIEATKMYGGVVYEEWDQKEFPFDLEKFKATNPEIYKNVATNITSRAYGRYDDDIQKAILDEFIANPKAFAETISLNLKEK